MPHCSCPIGARATGKRRQVTSASMLNLAPLPDKNVVGGPSFALMGLCFARGAFVFISRGLRLESNFFSFD